VLADDPRLDAPGRDTERVREARSQPQAVVDRVAEDPAPVEAGSLLQSRHERIDGVRDDDDYAGTALRELVGELVRDQRVLRQILESRRSDGERRRREQNDDIGVLHVAELAAAHAAAGRELERLLEVHQVRRDHLRPVVDEDDLVASAHQYEVEGGGCADAAGSSDECHLHEGIVRPVGGKVK
jgi:hypothetical protein